MTAQQPEALTLAQELELGVFQPNIMQNEVGVRQKSAEELRRLHTRVQELEAAQAQRAPLTRKQINECSRDAQIAFCMDKQSTYEVALTREVERRHGITQEKQG